MNADRDHSEEPCTDSRCDAQTHLADSIDRLEARESDAIRSLVGSAKAIDEVEAELRAGSAPSEGHSEAQGAFEDAVIHLDAVTLVPIGVSKPCPATTTAHLGFNRLSGVRVPCGQLADHDGPHVHHVEWTDPWTEDGA